MDSPEELRLAGYLDKISVQAGQEICARVSIACNDGTFDTTLVQVVCADPNPTGPGLRVVRMPEICSRRVDAGHQPIVLGSYAALPGPAVSGCDRSLAILFKCDALPEREAALLSWEDREASKELCLLVGGNGLVARINAGGVQDSIDLTASLGTGTGIGDGLRSTVSMAQFALA
jgi:N,N-dimethylformamidase